MRNIATNVERAFTHSSLAYYLYRYRYLLAFTLFGLMSILVEITLVRFVLPSSLPLRVRAATAFLFGLTTSFILNAKCNFRVPRKYLVSTFIRFSMVSSLSFLLNMATLRVIANEIDGNYALNRIVVAGTLFAGAYALHRKLTFRSARNFGIAIYASPSERVDHIFEKVGRAFDHVHIDLVDQSMNAQCGEVDLSKIANAKGYWPNVPLAMHIMSRTPSKWVEPTLDSIDWYLFHLDCDEDLFTLIANCQLRGKKTGIVWHVSNRRELLFPYLPHVDFVMVLGIDRPGQSGQKLLPEAVEVSRWLDRIRPRYGFELMFDGSVNTTTVDQIPATYLVAASAVLNAVNPVKAICTLKTSGEYERRAA